LATVLHLLFKELILNNWGGTKGSFQHFPDTIIFSLNSHVADISIKTSFWQATSYSQRVDEFCRLTYFYPNLKGAQFFIQQFVLNARDDYTRGANFCQTYNLDAQAVRPRFTKER